MCYLLIVFDKAKMTWHDAVISTYDINVELTGNFRQKGKYALNERVLPNGSKRDLKGRLRVVDIDTVSMARVEISRNCSTWFI